MSEPLFRVVRGSLSTTQEKALDVVLHRLVAEARDAGQPERKERGRWGRPSPEGPGFTLYNPSAFHVTEYF